MACTPSPDPAHPVPVAERTESLEVTWREGAAADRGFAEVEVRRPGGEGRVAPGAPVALPFEDGPHGLVRDIRPCGDLFSGIPCCLCSALHGHTGEMPVRGNKPCDWVQGGSGESETLQVISGSEGGSRPDKGKTYCPGTKNASVCSTR